MSSGSQYGKAEYWNQRYEKDSEPFEWYQSYEGMEETLASFLTQDSKVLVPGCGNSRLSEEIYEKKTKKVTSVDISSVAIEAMKEKHPDRPGLTYSIMDVRKLDFHPGVFDVIVDKGTLDSLLCSDEADRNAALACAEYSRVLAPGGVCLILSYGVPENRLALLQADKHGWDLKPTIMIGKPSLKLELEEDERSATKKEEVHYCYVCVKRKH